MSRLNKNPRPILTTFIVLGVLALLAAIIVPNFVPGSHRTSAKNACINNLRQVEGAKEQWALETHHNVGDAVTFNNVVPYIKNGMPKCPQGGTYTIGRIGENPTCSVPGHSL